MTGIGAIVRKELADHFSSYRFMILFALIAITFICFGVSYAVFMRQEIRPV